MQITSKSFRDGEFIAPRYATVKVEGGENVSLDFSWSGAPEATRSFALLIVDPHPVAQNWIHWMVVNMGPKANHVAEGASGASMPGGAAELVNSYGKTGYGGPQPPPGSGKHPYVCSVYALDVEELSLTGDVTLVEFEAALEGHVLERATMTGYFER